MAAARLSFRTFRTGTCQGSQQWPGSIELQPANLTPKQSALRARQKRASFRRGTCLTGPPCVGNLHSRVEQTWKSRWGVCWHLTNPTTVLRKIRDVCWAQRPSARSPHQVPKVDWPAWQRPPQDKALEKAHPSGTLCLTRFRPKAGADTSEKRRQRVVIEHPQRLWLWFQSDLQA